VSEQQVPRGDRLMNRKLSPASIRGRQRVLCHGEEKVYSHAPNCSQSSNKSQLSYREMARTFIFAKVGAWQFLGDLETQFSFVGRDCRPH
jgi:hypothetical protein